MGSAIINPANLGVRWANHAEKLMTRAAMMVLNKKIILFLPFLLLVLIDLNYFSPIEGLSAPVQE